jgi:hypothetical protein
MTNEEREAFLSQQRQNEYDLGFLANEDPSLYKAVMDKQAAERVFAGDAFKQDPLNPDRLVLNVPSQAAADYLQKQGTIQPLEGYYTGKSRRDLVDWFAPENGFKRDSAEKFMGGGSDNMGLGVADFIGAGVLDAYDGWNYLKDISQRNRDARALLTQELVDEGYSTGSIDFYKEFTKRLPEPEGSGEALFDVAFGVGEVAAVAKLSFKALGKFFKRFNPNASRLPIPEVNVADAVPADTPQFGALAAQQQQLDDIDDDFIPIDENWTDNLDEYPIAMDSVDEQLATGFTPDDVVEPTYNLDETWPEALLNNALLEREAAANAGLNPEVTRYGSTHTAEDDLLLAQLQAPDDDGSWMRDAYEIYNRRLNERIDTALATRPEYQTPSVIRDIEELRAAGEPPSMIEEYLAGVEKEHERDFGKVQLISQARNTGQLRDLYERYNLPIPKTAAEERAADLIIKVATGEPIDQSMRRGIDLDYLEAHATPYVFNKAKPTIQETLEAERQYGVLNDVSVGQETDMDALTDAYIRHLENGAFGNNSYIPTFSPSVRAAEELPQEKGSYTQLKAWMLKNGAKAKEMEWTGADEAFEGRTNVTKKELVDYLTDNQNLLLTDRQTAQGVMVGDLDGGDMRMRLERYVEDNLDDEVQMLQDNFESNWEYNTDFDSIADYIAAGNDEALDEIAKSMRVINIRNGKDLAESYPDGWVSYSRRSNKYEVFADRDEAMQADMPDFTDDARQSLEESLGAMRLYDTDAYNRNILGIEGDVADPSELEYAKYFPKGGTNMSETTYQFRDPTGEFPEDYFKESHFDDLGKDENLVAHARTAEFPVQGGGTAFHVGEAQSDLQQGIRKSKQPPRTREQELKVPQEEALLFDIRDQTVKAEDILNRSVFGDDVGMARLERRSHPKYAEKLETYKKVMADFKTKQSQAASENGEFVIWQPHQISDDRTFFGHERGTMNKMRSELDEFAQYIIDLASDVPPALLDTPEFSQYKPYINWAERYTKDLAPKLDVLTADYAKLGKAGFENTATGAPFVESTDAWVSMLLKRQLKEAVESGANFMTLPNPEMVKKYTYGDLEGHRTFYGDIATGNLLDIARLYDPDATLVGKLIETSAGPEPVSALPLTRRLVDAIMKKGISTYAVPLAVGTGAGYGALNQVGGQDGESGG